MNKILLISDNGPGVDSGGAQRTLLLFEFLKAKGYAVDLVIVMDKEWGPIETTAEIFLNWEKKYNLLKILFVNKKYWYLPNYETWRYCSRK